MYDSGRIVITGEVSSGGETCDLCGFVCVEQAGRGRFTIPAWIIQRAQILPFVGQLSLQVDVRIAKRFHLAGTGTGEFSAFVPGGVRDIPVDGDAP